MEDDMQELTRKALKCTWKLDSWGDHWNTDCAKSYIILEGTPKENDMKFCCYCGKEINE